MLRLGAGCSIEPEVDLSGFWVDGDVVHLGPVRVGARARVGARSMLCPGADIGKDAEVAPGSSVFGAVPDGEYWSGSPAERIQKRARGPWSDRPPPRRAWTAAYGAVAVLLSCLPIVAVLAGAALPVLLADDPTSLRRAASPAALAAGLGAARDGGAGRAGLGRGPHRRPGCPARRARGAQRRRAGGLDDGAGPRRRAHLAVPALRVEPHPDLAAAARRADREGRRGLDRADDPVADPGQRPVVPRRRHPDRRLRARRRLAAGRAGEDRQARVRRQLRDGRARPQGAQGVARRGALGGAAAQDRAGGRVVARQPARLRCGVPPRTNDAGRTYAPPTRLKVARALVEACRIVPVALGAGLAFVVAIVAGRAARPIGGVLLGARPGGAVARLRRAGRRAGRRWRRSGC